MKKKKKVVPFVTLFPREIISSLKWYSVIEWLTVGCLDIKATCQAGSVKQ